MRLHVPATEHRHRRLVLLILSLLFALVLSRVARAQSSTDAVYRLPDATIVDMVDVLPTPCGALQGLGATVRLVVLPYESHGYQARESLLHMLWEMEHWLDEYVKNRPTDTSTTD
jgi:hypothetical protein